MFQYSFITLQNCSLEKFDAKYALKFVDEGVSSCETPSCAAAREMEGELFRALLLLVQLT